MIENLFDHFLSFWFFLRASVELTFVADMSLALLLGFLFGYERSYHGRAAGIRTYGLVCMVSAALTSVSSHPTLWIEGHASVNPAFVDPTRTIQGIVTGIGFLGAGIIMQNGMKISGLTTAASIWAAAAIGVFVGLEFYMAAIFMTLMAELFVMLGTRFDVILPSRRPIAVTIQFQKGFTPDSVYVQKILNDNGYEMADGSLTIQSHNNQIEWRFVATSLNRRRGIAISTLGQSLPTIEGIDSFYIARARN